MPLESDVMRIKLLINVFVCVKITYQVISSDSACLESSQMMFHHLREVFCFTSAARKHRIAARYCLACCASMESSFHI